MEQYTLSLDSKAALQETQTGGKGANLARLVRYGFPVPPGFVITSSAFRDSLAHSGLQGLTQRGSWSEEDLEQVRKLLVSCPIPGSVTRSIEKAYERLGGCVAVRSSMVGEDSGSASFAGQLDTILGVEGQDALVDAVRKCWASLCNWRLWSYLAEQEAGSAEALLGSARVGVVVQSMVNAQAAGIAFSADPITGQPCVVIEATRGLGEALAQGLVEPDRYVVDARGVLSEAASGDGGGANLSDEQVLDLAELVRDVASLMGDPQDVEWAWDGRRFCLLQSRPITSLHGKRVYSNSMVSDMLPGLIKPLVWSVSTTSKLENVLGHIFTELVGPNDIDFSQLARRIHSRVYADNTMLGQLLESMGLPANSFEVMSRDAKPEYGHRRFMNRRVFRTMLRTIHFGWRHSRMAGELAEFIERHDRQLEPYRRAEWSTESAQALLVQAEQLTELYSETMWYNFIGQLNMMGRNRMMARLVERHASDVVPSDLIRGLMGLKSLDSNRELQDMVAQARAMGDEFPRLLVEQDDRTIRHILASSEGGEDLLRSMDAFLDRYGFLSTSGTDLSKTPWCENPTIVWQAIGRMALSAGQHEMEGIDQIREEAQARLRANLNPMQRLLYDRLLASTMTYIDLREKSSVFVSEDSFQMRRIFLAIADQLLACGALNQRDDIFYLGLDELRALVGGEMDAEAAKELTAARRKEMEVDATLDLPDTIYGDSVPTQPIRPAEHQECLTGISGSSGQVRGYARIVLDPAEAPGVLTREDILVVPFTDMSWTLLFPGIGGVVAETGGQLCHSAIVAREYGLPAVVNVKHATRLIPEGQPILVDGTRGRIYLQWPDEPH